MGEFLVRWIACADSTSFKLVLLSLFFLLTSSFLKAQSPYVPSGYVLYWSDEFSQPLLDGSRWAYRQTGNTARVMLSNGNSVTTMRSPKAISVNNGMLSIKSFLSNDTLYLGMIGTQGGKFEQKYGYFEARIKPHKLRGQHCAFWMQSPTYGQIVDDPANSGAEIDIYEFFGSGRSDRGVASGIFWNPYNTPSNQHVQKYADLNSIIGPTGEISDDFHIFGLLWTNSSYTFYIDGHNIFQTSAGLSKRAEYLILSLICNDWESPWLDPSLLPDSMLVDYVRVYSVPTSGSSDTSTASTKVNLALNKPVTYSDQQMDDTGTNPATKAVDGDPTTRWSARYFPQWIQVDLGKDVTFNRTEVVCYQDRAYQFIIEAKSSADSQFTKIADRSSNTDSGSVLHPIANNFDSLKARYVKITISGSSAGYTGDWVSLTEFRIINTNGATTGIEEKPNIPASFALSNYPNPFNPSTVINYKIAEAAKVNLSIYDITGRLIQTITNEYKQPGTYEYEWDASKYNSGIRIASGIYFARLQSGGYIKTIKMMLLK